MTSSRNSYTVVVVTRVEKLETLPSLHSEEHQAITDALNSLRVLDHEEAQYQAG